MEYTEIRETITQVADMQRTRKLSSFERTADAVAMRINARHIIDVPEGASPEQKILIDFLNNPPDIRADIKGVAYRTFVKEGMRPD